ncbi:hypothetical protein THIOSC13_20001 [uncultured Thiomicrorhabdus sp.]
MSRTGLLLHVVDIAPMDDSDPAENVKVIQQELEKYSDELLEKERWLVLNKTDLMLEDEVEETCTRIVEETEWQGPVFRISAVDRSGTQELMNAIAKQLHENKRLAHEEADLQESRTVRRPTVEEDFDF